MPDKKDQALLDWIDELKDMDERDALDMIDAVSDRLYRQKRRDKIRAQVGRWALIGVGTVLIIGGVLVLWP